MTNSRSFTEYVANTFSNEFWNAAEKYLQQNWDPDEYDFYKIHRPGEPELDDVKVEHVWVFDQPGMCIQFDVAVSLHLIIPDDNHHYDEYEEKDKWLMLRCEGDLDKDLEDMTIFEVSEYNGKNRTKNALDDSLVPVIGKDDLDDIAEAFLRHHYKKALPEPCWVDPIELATGMKLNIRRQRITEDGTVFGRSFFCECDSEVYDAEKGELVKERIPAKTVLVDPNVAFMRNLGAYNNTIVHECVHWDLHQKAFALARLYDKNLSNVSCKVSGGVPGHERDAVDWMEWQANALAPRIQMPKATFKKRADQLFSQFRRETDEFAIVDLIEKVITQLTVDFGVSKLAAKIRMIDVGYDEAMGAFIYVDDHYVRPYRTGQRNILKPNQTFTISAADAAIQIFSNMSLRKKTESGCFQFVENHLVLNDPLFIEQDILGDTVLTHYARNHMEECCLVFDLEIKNKYGEHYHSECFLNRDEATPVTFGVTFTGGYQNSTFDKQMANLEVVLEEENLFCLSLTDDYRDSLRKGMVWREEMSYKEVIVHSRLNKDEVEKMHETMSYREIAEKKKLRTDSVTKITNKEIGDRAGINEETVGRCISGTRVNQHTLILICLALHLPYLASMKILNTAGVGLKMVDKSQQWYHFVLMHMYGHLVTEIKDFLAARGADPL